MRDHRLEFTCQELKSLAKKCEHRQGGQQNCDAQDFETIQYHTTMSTNVESPLWSHADFPKSRNAYHELNKSRHPSHSEVLRSHLTGLAQLSLTLMSVRQ